MIAWFYFVLTRQLVDATENLGFFHKPSPRTGGRNKEKKDERKHQNQTQVPKDVFRGRYQAVAD